MYNNLYGTWPDKGRLCETLTQTTRLNDQKSLCACLQCAVTCGHGYQMRAVRCVSGAYGKTMDDRECNAASRPRDSQVH